MAANSECLGSTETESPSLSSLDVPNSESASVTEELSNSVSDPSVYVSKYYQEGKKLPNECEYLPI